MKKFEERKNIVNFSFTVETSTFTVSKQPYGNTYYLNFTGAIGDSHPMGIVYDDKRGDVYIAESSYDVHRISIINKTTLTVSRLYTGANIINQGTNFVIKSSLGNIWWTDNSGQFGVILVNGSKLVFQNVSTYGLHLTEVPAGSIWISVKGSTYVCIAKDILSVVHVAVALGSATCYLK